LKCIKFGTWWLWRAREMLPALPGNATFPSRRSATRDDPKQLDYLKGVLDEQRW
jgi:hypothetical protein